MFLTFDSLAFGQLEVGVGGALCSEGTAATLLQPLKPTGGLDNQPLHLF